VKALLTIGEPVVLPEHRGGEFLNPRIVSWGVYDLKSALEKSGSVGRWLGYRRLLDELRPEVIFFENVPEAVHTAPGAARVHGGLRATLELWAHDNEVRMLPVSIASAKKALTGSGGANKQLMRNAALRRFGVNDPTPTGDVADALGVLLAGVCKL
jgi:hypothetical protein